MKCHICKIREQPEGRSCCLTCLPKLLSEAARPDGAELRSSVWLGELEAALRSAETLREEAQRERGSLDDYIRLDVICIVIETALNAERSRSPSEKMSRCELVGRINRRREWEREVVEVLTNAGYAAAKLRVEYQRGTIEPRAELDWMVASEERIRQLRRGAAAYSGVFAQRWK